MDEINLKKALRLLWEHQTEIITVKEWTEYLNYPEDSFTKKVNEEMGTSPKSVLHRSKFKKLDEIILKNPNVSAIILADEVGLSGIQDLYDFIQSNRGCSIREYKNKVLKRSRNK